MLKAKNETVSPFLTPILVRALANFTDRKYSWTEVYKRTVKFASALTKIGIKKGDTVSFLAFNTPEIFEGHYLSLIHI